MSAVELQKPEVAIHTSMQPLSKTLARCSEADPLVHHEMLIFKCRKSTLEGTGSPLVVAVVKENLLPLVRVGDLASMAVGGSSQGKPSSCRGVASVPQAISDLQVKELLGGILSACIIAIRW